MYSSDVVLIVCTVASSLLSAVVAVTAVLTLLQNRKMIENSTRPYIGIYLASTHIQTVENYLVIQNFGQSSATIVSFAYNFDLAECSKSRRQGFEPFKNIEGSILLPGQAVRCVIDLSAVIQSIGQICFHIVYCSGKRKYEDEICVNLSAASGILSVHNTSNEDALSVISETLQDMLINSL